MDVNHCRRCLSDVRDTCMYQNLYSLNRKNMDIKILGSGCSRCKKTYETVKRVVEEDQVEGTVEYVTDIAKILDYDIMSMPAIVIDGKVVLNGQVPTADKVRELLEGEKKK